MLLGGTFQPHREPTEPQQEEKSGMGHLELPKERGGVPSWLCSWVWWQWFVVGVWLGLGFGFVSFLWWLSCFFSPLSSFSLADGAQQHQSFYGLP